MVNGTVYLIHFEKPYKGCRHYIGWTSDYIAREERHWNGNGSPLLKAVKNAGINFGIVRIWENKTRQFERQLKRQHNSKRFCPLCNKDILVMDYKNEKVFK